MTSPTQEQQLWFLKHLTWDMLDEGMPKKQALQKLLRDGIPQALAVAAVQGNAAIRRSCPHSNRERERLIRNVRAAIERQHPDPIIDAIDPCCDDDRTLYFLYRALSSWLYEPHPIYLWAAFGLSKMVGFGDRSLIKALSHDDPEVRYIAAFGLGKMGGEAEQAIDALKVAARDSVAKVSQTAKEAIRRIRAEL